MAIERGKIITITSVKGGVGKTTFTLSLASTYASLKKRVLIIDMDLFSGDMEALLNVDANKNAYTIYEDITNNNFSNLETYITKYNDKIDLIAAPKDPRYAAKMNGNFIDLLFSKVSTRYDVVLVDTNHFLNLVNLTVFDHSDQILYLINNSLMNVKSMRTMISIFQDMKLNKYKVLLYEASNKTKSKINKIDIQTILKDNIDYIVPTTFYIKDIDKYIVDNTIVKYICKYVNKKDNNVFFKIGKDLIK